jgi:hypothetical protein
MSTFPNSVCLLKEGTVLLGPDISAELQITARRYNPDTLIRNLYVQGVGAGSADRIEALRLKGSPEKAINPAVEIGLLKGSKP